jgi:hypothetical protein
VIEAVLTVKMPPRADECSIMKKRGLSLEGTRGEKVMSRLSPRGM